MSDTPADKERDADKIGLKSEIDFLRSLAEILCPLDGSGPNVRRALDAISTMRMVLSRAPRSAVVASGRAAPTGYKLLKDSTLDERSWKEDASHENGNYYCNCCVCDRRFVGHKRRVLCKVCKAEEVNPPVAQSASERTDNARLLWLETLLKYCPHAELTWNDDADEGPLGWRLLVESCSRLDLRAPTLEALIDLCMKADPDEDGDVVANATDATSDSRVTPK